MDFALTDEQRLIVDTTRAFVEAELYPHEAEVERTGHLRPEVIDTVKAKALDAGLYAANIPEEYGGAGLDTLTWLLYERELGRANYALHWTCVARPSNILCAGTPEQRAAYLDPCVRGEKWDCLAMTEPDAGSDLRGMKATARADGDDWILNGTKMFITQGSVGGFCVVLARTDAAAKKQQGITAFVVDQGTKGFSASKHLEKLGCRSSDTCELTFEDVRVPDSARVGAVNSGFTDRILDVSEEESDALLTRLFDAPPSLRFGLPPDAAGFRRLREALAEVRTGAIA